MKLFLNWSFIRCLLYVSKGFWKGECTDILYLLSYLFGTKFTGRKFYCWHRDNWPIGQWVINYLHCSRHSLQCMSIIFFPAWVYNIIQIHSGKISWPSDFVAHSVAALPHALKAHVCTLLRTYERSTCRLAVSPVITCIGSMAGKLLVTLQISASFLRLQHKLAPII